MKNKNKFILLGVIAIIVLLGNFLVYKFVFTNEKNSSLVNINFIDLETKIQNKESFVLVISQTGCSHCEQYLPELDHTLSNYKINANVLNISNLSDEEKNSLNQYVNFSGTPTTIFFIDGAEKTTLNRLVGYASRDKIIERLKSLGYID